MQQRESSVSLFRLLRTNRRLASTKAIDDAERRADGVDTPEFPPSSVSPSRRRLALVPIRSIERVCLFILTASGFLALVEPSPYEFVFAAVLIVFCCSGNLRLSATSFPLLVCLLGFSVGGFICLMPYLDESVPFTFTFISAYMCVTAVFYATLLGTDAEGRLEALNRGYVLAAILASLAGVMGYFHIGDFFESFTRYDRAAGTFKDPNVLGTFVILPLVYLIHSLVVVRIKWTTLISAATIVFGGVFLSFSRGAWMHTAGSIIMMMILTYWSASCRRVRNRVLAISLCGSILIAAALSISLSFNSIGDMFEVRASLNQSYDLGAQGRFGNQAASIPLLLNRPNGFGPHRFNKFFTEDPHEVYINAFASYGWLGGFSYLLLILMTLAIGWRIATTAFALQGQAIVIWSTLFFQILQGLQIDTDHWRHFWLMLGLVWGLLPCLRSRASEAPDSLTLGNDANDVGKAQATLVPATRKMSNAA
jgi:hypothetical protein